MILFFYCYYSDDEDDYKDDSDADNITIRFFIHYGHSHRSFNTVESVFTYSSLDYFSKSFYLFVNIYPLLREQIVGNSFKFSQRIDIYVPGL